MNIAVDRMFENNDWIAAVLFLVLILITILKVIYPKRFEALLGCLFSKKYFLDYSSELLEIFSLYNALLFFVQNLVLSLFIYVLFTKLFLLNSLMGFQFFSTLFIGVTLYLVFQFVLGKIVAVLFRFNEIFELNRMWKFSYLKSISILFLPILIFVIYAFPNYKIIYWVGVVVMLIFLIIRMILIIVGNIKQFSYNWFYFILYICTLEILPLVLLYLLVVK